LSTQGLEIDQAAFGACAMKKFVVHDQHSSRDPFIGTMQQRLLV
jgi:hypothetical protein